MFENMILWILIGLVASGVVIAAFPDQNKYAMGTVAAGIIGAFIGGFLYSAVFIGAISINLDPIAFLVAVSGSGSLLYIIRILVRNEEAHGEYS